MSTVVLDTVELEIPSWVTDLNSFRRWLDDPEFPEKLPVWWLRGKVWVDMSKEQAFSHNRVRTRITSVLDQLVADEDLGVLWSDGMFLTNADADIAGNPDAIFVSHEAIAKHRATLVKGRRGGVVEVDGIPDMVLEVVSRSSVKKDTQELFDAYWQAGIPEYWLVNARTSPATLDIWRHTSKGYSAVRKKAGWAKSSVFGKTFCLVEYKDRSKLPAYRLEVR